MNEKTIRIFELCKQLANLLGDKEAIADIKLLYKKHPDMFRDIEEVANVIDEVIKKPEIITNAKTNNALLIAKRLNEPHKMGDVVIQNDNGTNIVIHANKKREKEFERLKDSLVETPTLSTYRDLPTGELMIQPKICKSFGANALSANDKNNAKSLSQESLKNQGIKPKTKSTKQKFNSNNFEREM